MRPRDPEVLTGLAVFPVGTSDSGQELKVRRHPYVIVPVDPPASPIPDGAMYLEGLVFSLKPYPAEKVLGDYCKFKGLDSGKFKCHPVVFAKDLRREGKGALCIHQDGDRFLGRINRRP